MFIDLIKKHLDNKDKERQKRFELEYQTKRQYAISKLNHEWGYEEYMEYMEWFKNGVVLGRSFSASEYQEKLLQDYRRFLTPDEYNDLNNAIIDRKNKEYIKFNIARASVKRLIK